MDVPETKYTKLGDSYIAYQVYGEGPIDYLFVTGVASHIDMQWEYSGTWRFAERLAPAFRIIDFDRRGVGTSDPLPLDALPTWEDWTEDVRAVLDAAGSKKAVIGAHADGGPMGMLFAATYPERVSALVLANTSARFLAAPDYPIGFPQEQADAMVALVAETWGTEQLAALGAPSQADDPQTLKWLAKLLRAAATPRVAAAHFQYVFGLDARAVLPLIRVPTLIGHARDLTWIPVSHGRYLAEHIPGAVFEEYPSGDLQPITDRDTLDLWLDRFEEFLTGMRREPLSDRVLATVLFTDIVGSTERAAELGDRRWKELLDRLDRVVDGEIEKVGGRLVKATGDGHLATFDGPGKAIRCARSLIEAVRSLGIEIRAGLHTGEVELRGQDLGGIAVHIGARVSSFARPNEVVVSRTVTDLVAGSGIEFEDRGEHALKGIPGEWGLFSVRG